MAAAKTASPAQVAANRRNAQRSTGPRTEEGKAKARANAIKHGLTGAGVALPAEDAARVEALFAELHEEYAPVTRLGAELVHQMALLRVRQHRARRYQAARLRVNARHMASHFDQNRADQADALIDAIEAQPRSYRRQLLALPEGVDRLIAALLELLGDLDGPILAWTEKHHKRLDALFGYRPGDLPWNRPTRFSKALLGDATAIGDAEVADLPDGLEPGAWVFARTVEAIEVEVARLQEHRAALDLDMIAEDRLDAEEVALFDSGREGLLAQRYEAALGRELSRTLRDFHFAEALGDPSPEAELAPPPVAVIEAPTLAPEIPPAPPAADPKPNPGNEIEPELASSGESLPPTPPPAITAPAAPVATPAASVQVSRPAQTIEVAPHVPPVCR